jgi:hypothetical protein
VTDKHVRREVDTTQEKALKLTVNGGYGGGGPEPSGGGGGGPSISIPSCCSRASLRASSCSNFVLCASVRTAAIFSDTSPRIDFALASFSPWGIDVSAKSSAVLRRSASRIGLIVSCCDDVKP